MNNLFTITENTEYNSLEITFAEKPAAEIRDVLKSRRFRWNGKKSVWYGYADREELEKALTAAYSGETVEPEQAPARAQKQSRPALASLWERCKTDDLPGYGGNNDLAKSAREAAHKNSSSYDKEAAKIIRAHLRQRFPEAKFSVTSGGAGWLDNVDIRIKSSPWGRELVKGDPEAWRDRDRWDHYENSPELDAVLDYCNALHDAFDNDDGDIYADYGPHHDLYGDAEIDYEYTQTAATPEQAEEMARFKVEKAAFEQAEEERREREYQEQQKQREMEEAAAEKRHAENVAKAAAIEQAVTVSDIPEAEQRVYFDLAGGIGKEVNIEELRETIAERTAENREELHMAQVSRRVDFPTEELYNDFCGLFLYDFSFLSGKGCIRTYDGRVNDDNYNRLNREQRESVTWLYADCVAVSVCGDLRLIIDPEGYNYARYVYIVPENCAEQSAAEFEKNEAEQERPAFYFPAPIAEQAESVTPGEAVTIIAIDPWLCSASAERGILESCTPCRYAQYDDAARLVYTNGRKNREKIIHTGSEAVVYSGILPEIPENMKYTQISENMSRVNFAGSGALDFLKDCIRYYAELGYNPAIDTIQR